MAQSERRNQSLVAEQQLLTFAEPTRDRAFTHFKELGLEEGVEDVAVVDIEENRGNGLPRGVRPEDVDEQTEPVLVPGVEVELFPEQVEVVLLAREPAVVFTPTLPAELTPDVELEVPRCGGGDPFEEVERVVERVVRLIQVAEVVEVEQRLPRARRSRLGLLPGLWRWLGSRDRRHDHRPAAGRRNVLIRLPEGEEARLGIEPAEQTSRTARLSAAVA